ncbi:hypothetical protein BRADI_4g43823v3 [Brachypodium distachyon]|uniref:Uncharacterized protein n=1 Tax=Brachypodium distachyon TaxID=15368 RepID=A0A0Q3J2B9_BRADI|nr:hypothetical protein BRADI_4g43823v3 [Brachypodium distachyon]
MQCSYAAASSYASTLHFLMTLSFLAMPLQHGHRLDLSCARRSISVANSGEVYSTDVADHARGTSRRAPPCVGGGMFWLGSWPVQEDCLLGSKHFLPRQFCRCQVIPPPCKVFDYLPRLPHLLH